MSSYFNDLGINQSYLKNVLISLGYANLKRTFAETESMKLGTALHMLVLEPHKFEDSYVISPKFDKRTKDGKSASMKFAMDNYEKTALDEDDYNILQTEANQIKAILGDWLISSDKEIELYDEYRGVRIKGKADIVYHINDDEVIVIDIKRTTDFKSGVEAFNYAFQQVFYSLLLELSGFKVKEFFLLLRRLCIN